MSSPDADFAAPGPAPPAIQAEGVTRSFGAVRALDHVSLSIRQGEFFSLLGPSGCGKTTLLRLIAGLDLPDTGTLRIGGAETSSIPAHLRPVNTVFQSYALFPHMTVHENVAFGLRMKKVPRPKISERVGRVMELVQITELAQRRPAQLSGGQKQRVALARALVNEPQVLLLDEPLGALDLKLRKQLQIELHQLQRRLGITFVHVTHDQDEALVMSDRIAVMNAGKIEQLGTAEEIYEQPRTRFVAQFIGSCNLIIGTVGMVEDASLKVNSSLGSLRVLPALNQPATAKGIPFSGSKVTLGIRPEKIQVTAPAKEAGPNVIRGTIEDLVYSGAETQYRVRTKDGVINATALNTASGHQGFSAGESVDCHLPERALILLED